MQAATKAAQPEVGTQSGDVFDLKDIAVVVAPGGAVSKEAKSLLNLVFPRTRKEKLLSRWLDELNSSSTLADAATILHLCQRMMRHAHGKTAWQLLHVMRTAKCVMDEEEWRDYVAEREAGRTDRESELWEDEDEEDEDEVSVYETDLEEAAHYLAERDPWHAYACYEHAVEVAPTEEQRQHAMTLLKEADEECAFRDWADEKTE